MIGTTFHRSVHRRVHENPLSHRSRSLARIPCKLARRYVVNRNPSCKIYNGKCTSSLSPFRYARQADVIAEDKLRSCVLFYIESIVTFYTIVIDAWNVYLPSSLRNTNETPPPTLVLGHLFALHSA